VPRSRHLRFGVVALPAALIVVLVLSLPNPSIKPVEEVRGAVASPPDAAGLVLAAAAAGPRLAYRNRTYADSLPAGGKGVAPDPATLTGYVWPLARGRITLPFKAIPGGSRIKDGRLWHDGLDMASFCGDRVVAAHDGVVLAAGRQFDDQVGWIGDLKPYYKLLDRKKLWDDLPLVVIIDDGNGYRSVYAHFSKVVVKAGQVVRAGQRIGSEGMTGHASGCHVHYGLFSPFESATMGVRKDILRKLKLPKAEIARIDPLLVMPNGAEALKTRRFPVKVAPSGVTEPEGYQRQR
jgi:murein DD-endopeptidase MepM/ murein hydrolase activator NlpD